MAARRSKGEPVVGLVWEKKSLQAISSLWLRAAVVSWDCLDNGERPSLARSALIREITSASNALDPLGLHPEGGTGVFVGGTNVKVGVGGTGVKVAVDKGVFVEIGAGGTDVLVDVVVGGAGGIVVFVAVGITGGLGVLVGMDVNVAVVPGLRVGVIEGMSV